MKRVLFALVVLPTGIGLPRRGGRFLENGVGTSGGSRGLVINTFSIG